MVSIAGSSRGGDWAGGDRGKVGQSGWQSGGGGGQNDRWSGSNVNAARGGAVAGNSMGMGGGLQHAGMMQTNHGSSNMYMGAAAQAANMMMAAPGLARPQEARFDAYKNMNAGGQIRRY